MLKNNKVLELANEPIGKLLFKYGLPAVVGTVVMALYNVISRVYVGQGVGPDAIAGLAVTFPMMNIGAALGMLVGVGAAARTSIVLGENELDRAHKILGNSLTLTIIISLSYILVFTLFMDEILISFGASDVSLPYAREYMLYLLPGMFASNICYSFNNIMRASGFPMKAMYTMMIGAIVDVGLAPLFIFTLDMGVKGAAIATDISMCISALFVMQHFTSSKSNLRFRKGIYKINMKIVLTIMAIGLSPFVINIAGSFINAIMNNILYRLGSDIAVASAGIFITYTQMIVLVVIGVCQGMQPIVGYNYGAGRYDRMRKAFWISTIFATAMCTIGFIGAMVMPQYISRAFTTDIHLIEASSHALKTAIVVFWAVGIQIVSTTLFQSLGMAGKAFFLSLTRQVIFIIPLIFIMPHFMGIDGVWMAFPVSDLCATVVTLIMLHYVFKHLPKASA